MTGSSPRQAARPRLAALALIFAASLAVMVSPRPAQAKCQLDLLAELPVTVSGHRAFVDVTLEGQPTRMVVDSGATYSLLTSSTVDRLKLFRRPSGGALQMDGVSGMRFPDIVLTRSFKVAGHDLGQHSFVVDAFAGAEAGLLGQDILGLTDIEYDLPHGVIRMFRPRDCGDAPLAYWAKDKAVSTARLLPVDFNLNKHSAQVRGEVNGVEVTMLLDTGATISELTTAAAARAGVTPASEGVTSSDLTRGMGAKVIKTWVGRFKSFKIGDEEVKNSKIRFADVNLPSDMLLGFDFFISHRVFVSHMQRKVYLTYEGGPIFNADVDYRERDATTQAEHSATVQTSAAPQPTDAEGYSRRSAAHLARKETTEALADAEKALSLAPDQPKYLVGRARAELADHKVFLARADLDKAILAEPNFVDARFARASMLISANEMAAAAADLDAVVPLLTKTDDRRLALAELYFRADQPNIALTQFELWSDTHPDDPQTSVADLARCRLYSELNRELDKGLKICDRAVAKSGRVINALEGRGFLHLRRGEDQAALDDFNGALAQNPAAYWSLYGRSIVERRKGDVIQADADRAKAFQSNPKIPKSAAKMNFEAPPTAPAT